MKKVVILFSLLFSGTICFSQNDIDEVQIYQTLFGKEKKAIVEEFIQANPSSNDVFWALYDTYEISRKELGMKRIELLKKYAENYTTLDDVKTAEIIDQSMAQQKAMDNLLAAYYKKIKKEVGTRQAAQFFQIESYFLSMIRAYILEGIPFIGELEIE